MRRSPINIWSSSLILVLSLLGTLGVTILSVAVISSYWSIYDYPNSWEKVVIPPKPPLPVVLSKDGLTIAGEKIFLNCISFSAHMADRTPKNYDITFEKNRRAYMKQLNLVKQLQKNCVRLYAVTSNADTDFFFQYASSIGIYVIPAFWMDKAFYPTLKDTAIAEKVVQDFIFFHNKVRFYPSVFAVAIGNEPNNLLDPNQFSDELPEFFSLVEKFKTITEAETNLANRVYLTVPLMDNDLLESVLLSYASSGIDFWSFHLYRGCSFSSFLKSAKVVHFLQNKPFAILEYGIDAYHDPVAQYDSEAATYLPQNETSNEQQLGSRYQALYFQRLLMEVVLLQYQFPSFIAACSFEFVDEYWKGIPGDPSNAACKKLKDPIQNICGIPNTAFPDGKMHECWFGLFAQNLQSYHDAVQIVKVMPRQAAYVHHRISPLRNFTCEPAPEQIPKKCINLQSACPSNIAPNAEWGSLDLDASCFTGQLAEQGAPLLCTIDVEPKPFMQGYESFLARACNSTENLCSIDIGTLDSVYHDLKFMRLYFSSGLIMMLVLILFGCFLVSFYTMKLCYSSSSTYTKSGPKEVTKTSEPDHDDEDELRMLVPPTNSYGATGSAPTAGRQQFLPIDPKYAEQICKAYNWVPGVGETIEQVAQKIIALHREAGQLSRCGWFMLYHLAKSSFDREAFLAKVNKYKEYLENYGSRSKGAAKKATEGKGKPGKAATYECIDNWYLRKLYLGRKQFSFAHYLRTFLTGDVRLMCDKPSASRIRGLNWISGIIYTFDSFYFPFLFLLVLLISQEMSLDIAVFIDSVAMLLYYALFIFYYPTALPRLKRLHVYIFNIFMGLGALAIIQIGISAACVGWLLFRTDKQWTRTHFGGWLFTAFPVSSFDWNASTVGHIFLVIKIGFGILSNIIKTVCYIGSRETHIRWLYVKKMVFQIGFSACFVVPFFFLCIYFFKDLVAGVLVTQSNNEFCMNHIDFSFLPGTFGRVIAPYLACGYLYAFMLPLVYTCLFQAGHLIFALLMTLLPIAVHRSVKIEPEQHKPHETRKWSADAINQEFDELYQKLHRCFNILKKSNLEKAISKEKALRKLPGANKALLTRKAKRWRAPRRRPTGNLIEEAGLVNMMHDVDTRTSWTDRKTLEEDYDQTKKFLGKIELTDRPSVGCLMPTFVDEKMVSHETDQSLDSLLNYQKNVYKSWPRGLSGNATDPCLLPEHEKIMLINMGDQSVTRTVVGFVKFMYGIKLKDQLQFEKTNFYFTKQSRGFNGDNDEKLEAKIKYDLVVDALYQLFPTKIRIVEVFGTRCTLKYTAQQPNGSFKEKTIETTCWEDKAEFGSPKAANHLHALNFATEEYIFTVDCNMDFTMSQGFFFPEAVARVKQTKATIFALKENIFSSVLSSVGKFMGISETLFVQTYYSIMSALGTRYHYGHGDFVLNSFCRVYGGLSNADATVCTSEDIFLGRRVEVNGGLNTYEPILTIGKARDTTYWSAAVFHSKISSGAVSQLPTAEHLQLNHARPFVTNILSALTSSTFFNTVALADFSILLYIFFHLTIALLDMDIESFNLFNNAFAHVWIIPYYMLYISPVILAKLSREMKISFLEIFSSVVFYANQNRMMAHTIFRTFLNEKSNYLHSRRMFPSVVEKLRDRFVSYYDSHFRPAGLLFIVSGTILAIRGVGFFLYLIYPLMGAFFWCLGPVMFNQHEARHARELVTDSTVVIEIYNKRWLEDYFNIREPIIKRSRLESFVARFKFILRGLLYVCVLLPVQFPFLSQAVIHLRESLAAGELAQIFFVNPLVLGILSFIVLLVGTCAPRLAGARFALILGFFAACIFIFQVLIDISKFFSIWKTAIYVYITILFPLYLAVYGLHAIMSLSQYEIPQITEKPSIMQRLTLTYIKLESWPLRLLALFIHYICYAIKTVTTTPNVRRESEQAATIQLATKPSPPLLPPSSSLRRNNSTVQGQTKPANTLQKGQDELDLLIEVALDNEATSKGKKKREKGIMTQGKKEKKPTAASSTVILISHDHDEESENEPVQFEYN